MNITSEEFGTLAICAIRYCQGRQTYIPETVRKIILPKIKSISRKDLCVMLQDCGIQKQKDLYGDAVIDKPGWLEWRQSLEEELERRKRGRR